MRQSTIEMCLAQSLRKEERARAKAIAKKLGYTSTTRNGRVKPNVSAMFRAWMKQANRECGFATDGLFEEIRRGNPEFGREER